MLGSPWGEVIWMELALATDQVSGVGSAGVWGLGSRKGSPLSQIEAYQRPENLIGRAWIRSRN